MSFIYTIGDILGMLALAVVALFCLFIGALYALAWVMDKVAPIEAAIRRFFGKQ